MILLPEQFKLLFYHFIAGWCTGFSYQFEHIIKMQFKTKYIHHFIDFIWVTVCMLVFYAGLFQLNGGQTQFYCVVFFCIGFMIYLKFYFSALSFLFGPLQKIFTGFSLVFSHFFCIINMRKKKRRALFGSNKKDKAKKNQRSCPESN